MKLENIKVMYGIVKHPLEKELFDKLGDVSENTLTLIGDGFLTTLRTVDNDITYYPTEKGRRFLVHLGAL